MKTVACCRQHLLASIAFPHRLFGLLFQVLVLVIHYPKVLAGREVHSKVNQNASNGATSREVNFVFQLFLEYIYQMFILTSYRANVSSQEICFWMSSCSNHGTLSGIFQSFLLQSCCQKVRTFYLHRLWRKRQQLQLFSRLSSNLSKCVKSVFVTTVFNWSSSNQFSFRTSEFILL